jgi:hypothetical protein
VSFGGLTLPLRALAGCSSTLHTVIPQGVNAVTAVDTVECGMDVLTTEPVSVHGKGPPRAGGGGGVGRGGGAGE